MRFSLVCSQHLTLDQVSNERALRSVFQDRENDYWYLLNKADKTTIYNHRLQNIAILIYKALNNIAPSYINDLIFNIRYTNYQLRGSNILSLPRINTTSYGSKSIRYYILGPRYGISCVIICKLSLIFNLSRNLYDLWTLRIYSNIYMYLVHLLF